jgi:glycosyltransferase involved in cell wall biosynthesis
MKKKIKVFFFIDSFRVGGMHRQVYLIIKNLNREVFEPIIISQSQHGGFKSEFLNLGCKSYDLGWKSRYSFFLILFRFIKILRREKPENIFITQVPNFIYFLIAKHFLSSQIKLIGSFRAMNFWIGYKGKFLSYIEFYIARYFYFSCDYITANSKALVEYYSSFINVKINKPILCIYNGIDFELNNSQSTKSDLFGVDSNDFIVIMAARLDPMKDFETFLKAAKRVSSIVLRIKFFLLGDGVLMESLKRKINYLGLQDTVFLLGEVRNASEYLRMANISVLSTFGEGLSNTLLESMFLGTPCIATKVGGNIELLSNNRGILVNENDEYSLANAVLLLFNEKEMRDTISQNAHYFLTENFAIEPMVKQYEVLFLNS